MTKREALEMIVSELEAAKEIIEDCAYGSKAEQEVYRENGGLLSMLNRYIDLLGVEVEEEEYASA